MVSFYSALSNVMMVIPLVMMVVMLPVEFRWAILALVFIYNVCH